MCGDKTRILYLHGHTVLPGLTDSHCHIFGIGHRERTLNFEGSTTKEVFLVKVKEPMAGTPAGATQRCACHGGYSERRGTRPQPSAGRSIAHGHPIETGPAYAAFDEADKGSIEPGKLADLTVLSADIMKIPEPEILENAVVP